MQIATYLKDEHEQLALLVDNWLYDMDFLHPDLPNTMTMLLQYWDDYFPLLQGAPIMIREGKIGRRQALPFGEAPIQAPVPHPSSCRDGYAFRQHVEAARRNRKVPMIPEFDQYPIFYFTNHNAILGPGDVPCMPDHFAKLDFELECAIVIAREGRNIRAEDADSYIGGFMIMNDLSARTLQMEEMLLNLGPAKGKDFATVIGPVLVTPEELEAYKVPAKAGHTGAAYNLSMTCKVNGTTVSHGNVSDMDWTFAEIIERASYGATLYPGDVIGSGTVGTGCFLELNGTGKLQDPGYAEQWLAEGDVVEMEITGLGRLVNTIIREDAEGEPFSLLALKKQAP
jgi:fumarylacetoacetate (FAA) hydrolase